MDTTVTPDMKFEIKITFSFIPNSERKELTREFGVDIKDTPLWSAEDRHYIGYGETPQAALIAWSDCLDRRKAREILKNSM